MFKSGLLTPNMPYMEKAMDLAAMRQTKITENLANVSMPGYKRQDVDMFAVELGKKGAAIGNRARLPQPRKGGKKIEQMDTQIRYDGNNVDLEREVEAMVETKLRFKTLAAMVNNEFAKKRMILK